MHNSRIGDQAWVFRTALAAEGLDISEPLGIC
jgi:hypothetical protein